MQHTVIQPIDPTVPLFSPTHELRATAERAARALPQTEAGSEEVFDSAFIASSGPISERFCGAQAVSALLAFGSAPLLAHAAAVSSHGFVLCGLSCVVAAIAIQISERRRVVIHLTRAALALGVDPATARRQARATLELWLS